ncbi:60S ribosomal protein L4 [Pyrus ussuriensis x Pyrus communis]|uniref:60S ribosomal protein L4 n=1 Tax=Pyrus ussuriensis x Pyrus communis TaxID=2448454 RepID=A0A5N5F2E4_9ROSA|nr:60S ribosomal protein L4 [Pyrus ussuriensis x Pyrus communis]
MARILEAEIAWRRINEESEWQEIRAVFDFHAFWMDNAQIRIINNQIIISMPLAKGSNEAKPTQESQRHPEVEPKCKDCVEDVAYGKARD